MHNRRHFLKTIPAAVTGAAFWHCGSSKPEQRPNILWITCEDISPALGCYGDPQATTPNLDKLAEDGILYKRAYVTAPICAPARSCLISGLYATSLGTQHLRSDIPLPDHLKTLPEHLRRNGYFCSNNAKTDYNFDAEGMWDSWSNKAHWRDRDGDTPFFSVFNITISHEGHGNRMDPKDTASLEQKHDPANADLPPYFPDTPMFRKLWAHYYDLITVLDQKVGHVLQQLKDDGLAEDTIVFFASDHGFGLPRYKRWCYNSGMHVPFIVRIPEKFKHLAPHPAGSRTEELISFVDFAPTVLNLTGAPASARMEGQVFLGTKRAKPRTEVYGARDRADDVYDVCRAVIEERFIYIRNFMPHRPYIQNAIIFSEDKGSYAELRRVRPEGGLPPEARDMFQPKPLEELYDLQNDPYETNNLANNRQYQKDIERLRGKLDAWIIKTRDTGFLQESEMMIRAKDSGSVYEMARDPRKFDIKAALEAAKQVGNPDVDIETLQQHLTDPDSAVRFWTVTALLAAGEKAAPAVSALKARLNDDSRTVQVAAAETLCKLGECDAALPVLAAHLRAEKDPWLQLQAAMAIRHLGENAEPIKPQIQAVRQSVAGNVWNRYKSWMYPMFIGMALDSALLQLGETIPPRS